jgi:SpoIID/LytB domain protein
VRLPLRSALVVAASVAAMLVAPARASAYPSSHIEFVGHGWGHGRGLGQYGALGYAIDEDKPYSEILDHFYGGTVKGAQPDGLISVRLTAFDGKDIYVTAGAPYTIGSNAFAANEVGRIHRDATTGLWTISRAPSLGDQCSGTFTVAQDALPATTEPEAKLVTPYEGDDVKQLVQAISCPDMTRRHYRGSIMARVDSNISRAVNLVMMEQYLRGVVPRESPASWGDLDSGRGINALKAQAVAARSYAWAEQRSTKFKTCDTTSCQVYGGAGLNNERIENVNSDRAVAQTGTEVRAFSSGGVARTEFSSSTGGYTAGGTFTAVPDSGDDVSSNPNHSWNSDIVVTKVQEAYPSIGTLQTIAVSSRNGLGDDGGRALQVKIVGDKASVTVSADALRSKLGLKSDWYRIIDPSLNAPAVGLGSLVNDNGLLLVSRTGEALSYGAANTYGSMEGIALNKPVVGVAMTQTGKGYWMAASDGGIFRFGDAPDLGSLGNLKLNQPIVGIAPTITGKGFYLVASDGGIFCFGDAKFLGSMGGTRLNQPVVGMAVHPTGTGYYMVARDGGIFTFGSAQFHGSTGNIRLNQPIVGMTVHPRGLAYWFVAADGGVFSFPSGSRYFYGSLGGTTLAAPISAMATSPTGNGYWLGGTDGALYNFGDAGF